MEPLTIIYIYIYILSTSAVLMKTAMTIPQHNDENELWKTLKWQQDGVISYAINLCIKK